MGSLIRAVARGTAWKGLWAVAIAVFHLVWLRGLDFRLILLFVLPPMLAILFLDNPSATTRRLAVTFLLAIGVGAIVSQFPDALPNMGDVDRRLPRVHDRVLTWYTVVYLTFFLGILPTVFFYGELKAHRRGGVTRLSRFTCYVGLMTVGFLWLGFPVILGSLLGLWQFPR